MLNSSNCTSIPVKREFRNAKKASENRPDHFTPHVSCLRAGIFAAVFRISLEWKFGIRCPAKLDENEQCSYIFSVEMRDEDWHRHLFLMPTCKHASTSALEANVQC
jgi:hypothetical protein